jgi:vancomycin permeability regulator SanA
MRYLKTICIIVLALAACDLFAYLLYGHIVNRTFEGTNPPRADCALVFFNDFTEDWHLNDETIRRCHYALTLLLKQKVSSVVCSGGNRPRRGKSGAKLMAQWFSEHGVPQEAINTETDSCETVGNIRLSITTSKALGYDSMLLVSSPLHLYRIDYLLPNSDTLCGMALSFAPYPRGDTFPALGVLELLRQTHYEWISFSLYLLLPKKIYDHIIYYKRGCKPGEERLS